MNDPLVTLEQGDCKAEIYATALPGQFSVRYCGQQGDLLAEDSLTGVSSYKQRENEIRNRLAELCDGKVKSGGELSDSGEY